MILFYWRRKPGVSCCSAVSCARGDSPLAVTVCRWRISNADSTADGRVYVAMLVQLSTSSSASESDFYELDNICFNIQEKFGLLLFLRPEDVAPC